MTAEEMVKYILENEFGLKVEKIPECEEQTPDYFASIGDEQYFIEVKEKEANPQIIEGREVAFSDGQLYEISESIQPKTVLQNVVRAGKKQIESYAKDQDSFRVIWVHCSGVGYDATKDQIESGLYGSETITDFSGDNAFNGLCYYFGESQFFRYRDKIDAVVVSTRNNEAEMYLNNYSPRYEQIKTASLARKFGDAARDPLKLVKAGKAFIVDDPIDRKDKGKVLDHLKNKYGTDKLQLMNMKHYEAHVAVPTKEM